MGGELPNRGPVRCGEVPVQKVLDDRPQVLLALVPVVHVVAVLPQIDAEEGDFAVSQWTVGVRRGADLQALAVPGEPQPTRSEVLFARPDEGVAERPERAELAAERGEQLGLWPPATAALQRA